jgi:tyrosinase
MSHLTRRSFVLAASAGAAVIPFEVWLAEYGYAQYYGGKPPPKTKAPPKGSNGTTPAPGNLLRPEATSPAGKANLVKYAEAVRRMRALPAGDPRSWTFQWYIHAVNAPQSEDDANDAQQRAKAAEIARIYGANQSPERALAGETWGTCQTHFGGDGDNFLPWHRMQTFFFERIIRAVLQDPSFVLPYWNYTSGSKALPVEFRQPNDQRFASLYIRNRSRNANGGQAIDAGQPTARTLNARFLANRTYSNRGEIAGFCQQLDREHHGGVHVLTGDERNMGDIPTAANDPVFWIHHANVDRLWASWNAAGRTNPTGDWLTREWVFADENGRRVAVKVQDVLDLNRLGMRYDRLETVPGAAAGAPAASVSAARSGPLRTVAATAASSPIAIGRGITTVSLRSGATAAPAPAAAPHAHHGAPAATPAPDAGRTATDVLTGGSQPAPAPVAPAPAPAPTPPPAATPAPAPGPLPAGTEAHLVLRGLTARAQPGTLFHVYVNLPAGSTRANLPQDRYVGSFNYFDVVGHRGHGRSGHAGHQDFTVSFDVTAIASLLSSGPTGLNVSVIPGNESELRQNTDPVVQSISLVHI